MPPEVDRRRVLEIASAIRGGALAVEPSWLQEARAALLTGDDVQLAALSFGFGSAVTRAEVVEGGVAVISIRGPLLEGILFTDYSDILEAVQTFREDATAKAIVLDIDTPGGVIHGALWQLAEAMRAVRDEKPIWAVANEQTTSAGYLVAAQAGRILAGSRSATLGSLGVIATHVDRSKAIQEAGLSVTEVVTGRLKNLLTPNQPLGKEGRAFLNELVEAAFTEFIEHVEAGRGMSEETIRGLEGGVFIGAGAVERGLADEVMDLDDAIGALVEQTGQPDPAGASASGPAATTEVSSMSDPKSPKGSGADTPKGGAPEKPGAPAAEAPPSGGGQVVDLDAAREEGRKAAAKEARERVQAITKACQLAGQPERVGEFLETDLTAEQVGQKLLEDRAAASGDEVSGHHVDAGAPGKLDPSALDPTSIYERRAEDVRRANGELPARS